MRKLILSAVAALALGAGAAQAAEQGAELPSVDWSFQGVFGRFDEAQLQRGWELYKNVCHACHSLNYVAFRHLEGIGFSEDEVKEIAAQYQVPAPPNEWGEVYVDGERLMREAKPFDTIPAPFANEQAARAANGGALPPDLSLMVKARKGGPDYLYGILVGYGEAPEDVELMAGMSYNKYFPGHQIAMPQPLWPDAIEYPEGMEATLEQEAKDLTAFLAWTASPEMDTRKSMGLKVLLYVLLLTALMYALKRKIWSDVH